MQSLSHTSLPTVPIPSSLTLPLQFVSPLSPSHSSLCPLFSHPPTPVRVPSSLTLPLQFVSPLSPSHSSSCPLFSHPPTPVCVPSSLTLPLQFVSPLSPSHSSSCMLSGKLQDSLSEGVSRASRLMSRSVSSSSGERAAAEYPVSPDFTLRSAESVRDRVRLRVGATRRFFLMGFPERA
ncbi:hypothetical protein J4Q44_G00026200, partial [Coregonus suidteri]